MINFNMFVYQLKNILFDFEASLSPQVLGKDQDKTKSFGEWLIIFTSWATINTPEQREDFKATYLRAGERGTLPRGPREG